jgi:DNA primase small subunit
MKVLNTLPNDSIRQQLYTAWEKSESLSGAERWSMMRAATTAPTTADSAQGTAIGGGNNNKKQQRTNYTELESWRYKLVFTHCYARLDVNVSKSQNHLLKSPFCVHPKTGRVCVPIDPENADAFDPFTVPTVRSLCEEVSQVP